MGEYPTMTVQQEMPKQESIKTVMADTNKYLAETCAALSDMLEIIVCRRPMPSEMPEIQCLTDEAQLMRMRANEAMKMVKELQLAIMG